jgi:hypothetical protein
MEHCMTTPSALELQLKGWSLTTAEIIYRMPDHRNLLQSYIWQEYDQAPKFPRLIKFLDFWARITWTDRWRKCGWRTTASSALPKCALIGQEWRIH